MTYNFSSKTLTWTKNKNINTIKKELHARKRCQISRCSNWLIDSEQNSFRRSKTIKKEIKSSKLKLFFKQNEVVCRLEEHEEDDNSHYLDEKRMQQYGNLFYLLQSEPRHIATLCRLVSLAEIDTLLQTVMFTLYGNQYESREEHLLLTMFQVQRSL